MTSNSKKVGKDLAVFSRIEFFWKKEKRGIIFKQILNDLRLWHGNGIIPYRHKYFYS